MPQAFLSGLKNRSDDPLMENTFYSYVKNNFLKDKNSSLDFVLHSGGRGEAGFVSIVFYSKKKPVVVAKIARGGESNLEREYQNLRIVHDILRGSMPQKTVEYPFSFEDLSGGKVLFKEYKDGVPGDVYLSKNKKNVRKFLRYSTDWLSEFLRETMSRRINKIDEKRATITKISENSFSGYAKCWIEKESFFLAPSHSDLVVSNFLVDDSGITGVIDFESFTLKGFPEADLLGIIVSTSTTLFGLTEKAIIKPFFEENYLSKEVNEIFRKYCNMFKIDPRDFVQVMPIYSDRAIFIAEKWGNDRLLNFHKKLKQKLINNKDKLVFNVNY